MYQQTHSVADGFSLVEVLVALLIFSIGMLSSGLMILKSLTVARHGFYQIKAIDLAQMQQEAILAQGFKERSLWQKRIEKALPKGEGHVSVQPNNDKSALVNITVSWQSSFDFQKKQTLSLDFTYHEPH